MYTVALFARLEAKAGKEKEVAKFLEAGLAMANQETTTPVWFALRLGPTTFGIFDAFTDESGRQAHLNGPIAKALMAQAPELFSKHFRRSASPTASSPATIGCPTIWIPISISWSARKISSACPASSTM